MVKKEKKFRVYREKKLPIIFQKTQPDMYNKFCRNPALNESDIFTQQEIEFISHFFLCALFSKASQEALVYYLEKSSYLL